jgi:hypothetical protein
MHSIWLLTFRQRLQNPVAWPRLFPAVLLSDWCFDALPCPEIAGIRHVICLLSCRDQNNVLLISTPSNILHLAALPHQASGLCRGKVLAAFLKSIGFIIPLMDAMYANYYTREVMVILVREFQTPDEEMKKIVLKVVKQCVGTDGVEPDYIRHEILPEFFRNFWVRRMALDRRNYRQLVETTVELANKVSNSTLCTACLLQMCCAFCLLVPVVCGDNC